MTYAIYKVLKGQYKAIARGVSTRENAIRMRDALRADNPGVTYLIISET